MDYSIIPLFKSQFSLGRSILTLETPQDKEKDKKHRPDSIFEILAENSMDEFVLVDDSLNGFFQAQDNAKNLGVKLMFGVRATILDDATIKDDDSRAKESRVVIFCHNKDGYRELIKLWSYASQDGFYYRPRIDKKILASLDTKNLSMAIPFYDSYIYRNNFEQGLCVPDFLPLFKKVIYFTEDNDLPIDDNLSELVVSTAKEKGEEVLATQSIYYKRREDYLAYLTFRCIHNRTTLSKPNLDGMCSDSFCFEEWQNKNDS